MRLPATILPAFLAIASAAHAQADAPTDAPVAGGMVSCSELNNRAMEATLVIRQHASVLSFGIEEEARAQGFVALGWLDQWTGRLRGLVDVAESAQCFDDGDAETYRRALATATRVANTAREELLRPGRVTAQPQPPRRRH